MGEPGLSENHLYKSRGVVADQHAGFENKRALKTRYSRLIFLIPLVEADLTLFANDGQLKWSDLQQIGVLLALIKLVNW